MLLRVIVISSYALLLIGCSNNSSSTSELETLKTQGFPTPKQITFKGIEECHNYNMDVSAIANRSTGPLWTYTHNKENYTVAMSDLILSSQNQVVHLDEDVVWAKCNGNELVARHSIRKIKLLNLEGQKMIETSVFCVGNFPSGNLEDIINGYNPCKDDSVNKN